MLNPCLTKDESLIDLRGKIFFLTLRVALKMNFSLVKTILVFRTCGLSPIFLSPSDAMGYDNP